MGKLKSFSGVTRLHLSGVSRRAGVEGSETSSGTFLIGVAKEGEGMSS